MNRVEAGTEVTGMWRRLKAADTVERDLRARFFEPSRSDAVSSAERNGLVPLAAG